MTEKTLKSVVDGIVGDIEAGHTRRAAATMELQNVFAAFEWLGERMYFSLLKTASAQLFGVVRHGYERRCDEVYEHGQGAGLAAGWDSRHRSAGEELREWMLGVTQARAQRDALAAELRGVRLALTHLRAYPGLAELREERPVIDELLRALDSSERLAEEDAERLREEGRVEGRGQRLTQYRVRPNEESADTHRHPWHSPKCYEGGAHRDSKACTCGLTRLEEERSEFMDRARRAEAEVERIKDAMGLRPAQLLPLDPDR